LLVVRNESLAAGIARYLRDRIAEDPGVDVLLGHEVRAVSGGEQLEQVGAFGDAEDD
jgi:thioredoxin reductase